MSTAPTIDYEKIKGVHKIPLEELYTSGHRTCQGCESATTMRGFIKVAGPRTVVTGSTGCMYVANTSYMTTPWIVPWMHTQLGAGGSSAVGMAAGLRALKRKGKIKDEKINVINFSGDLGAGDMGIGGISAALQSDYDLLIIMYDNNRPPIPISKRPARRPTARRRRSRRRERSIRSCSGAGKRTSPACLPSAIRPAATSR